MKPKMSKEHTTVNTGLSFGQTKNITKKKYNNGIQKKNVCIGNYIHM